MAGDAARAAFERSERDVVRRHAIAVLADRKADPGARAAARRRLEDDAAGAVDLGRLDEHTLALLHYALALGRGEPTDPAAEVARAARQLADRLAPPPPPAPAAPCGVCAGDPARVLQPGLPAATLEVIRRVERGEVELVVEPAPSR